jgi:hypothetical protein
VKGSDAAIVVFLGPSLPLEEASPLLDARYLPPAGFADVYRLIGSGAQAIVLIDGVFHGRAPVWQRELLYAMDSGIRVYGASSMGALRAAELRAHGMVGIGTIYDWYAGGEIDGDDEVALLYADVGGRYRLHSQPLVNLRFNLREAAARGLIEREEAAGMTADLAVMPFWERTMAALWEAPTCRALDPPRLARLRAFFARDAIDLKGRDAALALAEVARRERDPGSSVVPVAAAPSAGASYHDRFQLLERAFRRDGGEPVRGRTLAGRVLGDPVLGDPSPADAARRRLCRWSLAARFFARQWALGDAGVSARAARATVSRGASPVPAWLRERSLTAAEHDALRARDDLWTWLVSQPAEGLGLPPALQDEALLTALPEPAMGPLEPVVSRAVIARALPYVAAWCEAAGASPSPEERASLSARWRDALESLRAQGQAATCDRFLLAVWALESGPVHFGYTTWSAAAELLRELQITGSIAAAAGPWSGVDA